MAISIKSVAVGTTDGSSATVSVTSAETIATAVGDLVVVIHANNFFTLTTMGTPSATGSPTFTHIADSDGGTNNAHVKAWWYVANTAGAQTVTVTETGTANEEKALVAYVLGSADTTSPVDGTPAARFGTSTTETAPVCGSVTTSQAGSLLLHALCDGGGNASTSYTPPSGVTKDEEWHPDSFYGGATGHKPLAGAGATGDLAWTTTGARFASLAFAIKAAAGGATIAPDGVSVPVALGAPALTDGSMSAAPAGISVPVALGAPTLAWSATVAPNGISVPVVAGSPAVGAAPIAPAGISVPVTLGAPTLAWTGSISPDGISVPVAVGAPTLNIPGSIVTRPNTGVVTRPNTGPVVRPNTGTVVRPNTGIVTRSNTGTVTRP